MRFLLNVALLLLVLVGVSASPARATPLSSGAATVERLAPAPAIEKTYWYRRPYYYRPYYYRPYFHRPYYYRPHYYRPRFVCRIRYTHWGPRRVCWRRW
jgi:hypothetical protein